MNTVTKMTKKVDQVDLEKKVKAMYREVALHPNVQYHFEMGRELAERLGYPSEVLDYIPSEAIDSFAGVGYYFDLANIQKGESIIDLGSGSGMDVFYAALATGEEGDVLGIDMTIEQIDKSIMLSHEHHFNNVAYENSYIETLPLKDESADVIISNGVINLSNRKAKVFSEAARVLKKGGRLAISDIVSSEQLPDSITDDATLWAACIGGAVQVDDYLKMITDAGFKLSVVKDNPYAFISNSAKGATEDYGIKSISILAIKE
jgi:arsenite methyltransferase